MHIDESMIDLQHMESLCVGQGLRRAARAMTRRYDAALRPAGLTLGQFSILTMVTGAGPIALGTLAGKLGMDRTTMSRDLGPLQRRALVESVADPGDRRSRRFSTTAEGHRVLQTALPLWAKAQETSLSKVPDWPDVRKRLDAL